MLMDQSFSAGVGNIYRTEILYEAGVHPNQPANTLTRKEAPEGEQISGIPDLPDSSRVGYHAESQIDIG